jgi:hypothetical protein
MSGRPWMLRVGRAIFARSKGSHARRAEYIVRRCPAP